MQKIFFTISFHFFLSLSRSLSIFRFSSNFDSINITALSNKMLCEEKFDRERISIGHGSLCGIWWGLTYWNNQVLSQRYSQTSYIRFLLLYMYTGSEIRLKQLENYARNIFVWTYFFQFYKHTIASSWRPSSDLFSLFLHFFLSLYVLERAWSVSILIAVNFE